MVVFKSWLQSQTKFFFYEPHETHKKRNPRLPSRKQTRLEVKEIINTYDEIIYYNIIFNFPGLANYFFYFFVNITKNR